MPNTVEIILLGKDELSGITDKAAKSLSGIGDIAKGAFSVGLGAATAGLGALAAGFGIAVNEAIDAQAGIAQLDSVLKSTNNAVGLSKDQLLNLAGGLSEVTRFSDDTVLAGENMLLTFTNIGKDVFPQATKTLLDMSQAMGSDPKQAAIQLGKALNDPVAGISALSRVGVTFTEDQKKVIEKLVETGQTAKAQEIILGELNREFGGSAEAAGKTFAGQLDIAKNSLLNMAEGIGTVLLPIGTELLNNFFTPALPIIQSFATAITQAITDAIAMFKNGESAIDIFSTMIGDLFGPSIAEKFNPLLDTVARVEKVFATSWPMIQTYANDAIQFIKEQVAIFAPFIQETIGNTLNTILDFWSKHGSEVMAVVNFLFRVLTATIGGALAVISGIISGAVTLITGIWSAFSELLKGNWREAWNIILVTLATIGQTILNTITTVLKSALDITGTKLEDFRKTWETIINQVWTLIKIGMQNVYNTVSGWIESFKNVGLDIMRGLSDGLNAGIGWVVDAAKSAVQGAIDAAKHALGIKSPSKVFMNIGLNTMSGFAEGISGNTYLPVTAMNNASKAITQTTNNNYNLTVNSNARSEDVTTSFGIMKALYA